jgi:hypothetical protein
MPGKGTRRFQVRIPDDVKVPARKRAQELHTNLSAVIVALLQAWLRGDVTVTPDPADQ